MGRRTSLIRGLGDESAVDDCGVVISVTGWLEWFTVCEVALSLVKSSARRLETTWGLCVERGLNGS